ncbi:hypothetical protein ACRWQL_15610 [Shewanella sp. HL-SH4]|uniref:hypothetical protein n=1 Tax=Shewanella sp. HL-SH4 TaxID=3436240 RepID=UPI003EBACE39
MKKVFNASVLAAAVALSFGANAADISISAKANITKEASAAKVAVTAFNADITFYNRQELAGGDIVYISFPLGTVLPVAGEIFVDKGTGVGSFKSPVTVVPATATVGPKIKLEVTTGSPVLNNSKTVIKLGYTDLTTAVAATYVPVSGNAVYSAEDGFSGSAKDTTGTNSVALTTTVDQETVSVTTKFDGFVKRLNRDTYETSKGTLVAEVTSVRNPATVKATPVVAGGSQTLVLKAAADIGNVSKAVVAACTDFSTPAFTTAGVASCTTGALVAPAVEVLAAAFTCADATKVPACKDTVTFDTASLVHTATATAGESKAKFGVYLVPTATKDIPTTTYSVTRSVVYQAAPTNLTYKYLDNADLGKFKLDASVVNVPYLPVGYDLTPNVEIANAGSTDAEIQIEGFDQNGVVYTAKTLTVKAGKKAVTKVSEADIETAFGLPANSKKKLSVTFVIDANAADITLAPYYRQNESRVNVMSDQYKKAAN